MIEKTHKINERKFSKPKVLGARVKIELDLSSFAEKISKTSSKSEIDKLDIGILGTAPVSLI